MKKTEKCFFALQTESAENLYLIKNIVKKRISERAALFKCGTLNITSSGPGWDLYDP